MSSHDQVEAPPAEAAHGGDPTLAERSLADRLRDSVTALATRVAARGAPPYPPDFSAETIATIEAVRYATMTSPERIAAVCDAVAYVTRNEIPGAWVECGVWRGGSTMAAALTLERLGDTARDLYLCDTFSGMTSPTDADAGLDHDAEATRRHWERSRRADGRNEWTLATITDVKANMATTGYPANRVHYVAGPVEETLPDAAPEQIAILRLDTDWYASTRHELEVLEPRLAPGGVLIVDDYGHWSGARKAVDEYFSGRRILLDRIDYTGRVAVKQW